MSLTITDLECHEPEQFVRLCRDELKRYPRSPVVVTPETAKDIEASAIQRMTAAELAEAEREFRKMEAA